ncbi:alpha/beta hydrolase fold [Phyllobacterium sp. CL33Tsu]|uniref:alpha/beta fold hydrolase n=1 Tax=Phyllobacterium sp. CL33Tsu TaxID=1798191 RepID=UPI0008EB93C9|nr:alpha/beta fold hydrolase [Phyllobacterium sp. CL33Tsu]SFJ48756.1 alpha/beta hydrolase fold [Phyllobacterium sp. CL33Tsu]
MAATKYRFHLDSPALCLMLFATLLFLAAMLPAVPALAAAAEFRETPCWFALPKDRDMRCGHLLVPENRSKADSATIELAVVIFEPDRVRHDPVVYLNGGPGQAARIETREEIDDWWSFIDNGDWLRGRRLVVVDQRGVGLSKPSLSCAEHYSPKVWGGIMSRPEEIVDFDGAQKNEVKACRDALQARHIDLSAYNTAENAADIHDLRSALNIDKWVVFGISYGTKLALQVLEDHPENLVAVVLDSTLPLDVDYVDQDAANFDGVLKKLEKDCAARQECGSDGTSLRTMITEIVQQLDAQPVLLRLKAAGEPSAFTRVSGNDFLEVLFNQFYDRDSIELLPQLIKDTANQNYGPLAEMIGLSGDDGDAFADGMHLSIVCNDGVSAAASFAAFPLLDRWAQNNFYSWACPLWPTATPKRAYKSLAQNRVPVLLLAGDYDPATPTSWAERVIRTTGHSQLVLFRGVGHDVLDTTECGGEVVADFLDNPNAKVSTPCIGDMTEPHFGPPDDKPSVLLTGSAQPAMLHR